MHPVWLSNFPEGQMVEDEVRRRELECREVRSGDALSPDGSAELPDSCKPCSHTLRRLASRNTLSISLFTRLTSVTLCSQDWPCFSPHVCVVHLQLQPWIGVHPLKRMLPNLLNTRLMQRKFKWIFNHEK